MSADQQPACIVLGLETQIGLGIVRELGRLGVPVIGIAQSSTAIGLRSRYLSRGLVVEEPRSDALIACLQALGDEYGDLCLLAVSEINLGWLMEQRLRLGRVRPVLPSREAIQIVSDKTKTLALACSLGITIPNTIELTSVDHLESVVGTLNYPVILKWKDPAAVMPLLSAAKLPFHKIEYAPGAQELRLIGKRYAPIGRWPLIQQYCPGFGLGQFFFMHQGKALRRFQHVRIAEWPPEGGFSSVCDSVSLDEHIALQNQSIELLRAIGWEGLAMVEYRFDPQTGRAVLMEINGRFWGSFPLAVHCKAGFAYLAYCVQGAGRIPALDKPLIHFRCRMVATEIKRLFRIIFRPEKIPDPSFNRDTIREIRRFVTDFFRPNVKYYVWDADDPRPFLTDIVNMFRRKY